MLTKGVDAYLLNDSNHYMMHQSDSYRWIHGSGNNEGYIHTTSILDMECGEELELNRDIACIYLVIALTDWITHEGTTGRQRKRSLDKSSAS